MTVDVDIDSARDAYNTLYAYGKKGYKVEDPDPALVIASAISEVTARDQNAAIAASLLEQANFHAQAAIIRGSLLGRSAGLVEVALCLDQVSRNRYGAHWLIEMTPEEARRFVERGDHVLILLVTKINELLARPDLPDNAHFRYEIGAEYSRVLYLKIRRQYLKGMTPKTNYLDIKLNLEMLAAVSCPKEFGVTEYNDYTFAFRFWWG